MFTSYLACAVAQRSLGGRELFGGCLRLLDKLLAGRQEYRIVEIKLHECLVDVFAIDVQNGRERRAHHVVLQDALLHESVFRADAIVADRVTPADAGKWPEAMPYRVGFGRLSFRRVFVHADQRIGCGRRKTDQRAVAAHNIASRIKVSLPVSEPIRRFAAWASLMLSRVRSTLNDASLIATM